ncbi:MAG: ArnT family glycosyltransferase [Isosphaeraceae bacterium]
MASQGNLGGEVATVPGRAWREALLVGFLALTLNLVGNGRISLWDRDEPRYAGCTREMRASGDWIHPTFNAEPRYHKPVLIYWLMLAGTAVGGDNPFGARLVSALMGTATVVTVWWWGRRVLGPRTGRLAALILATAPLMVAESKLATTDATLTFFVVGCQVALWELSRGPSRIAAAVFWSFLGLAVLTKSPAGPVLLGASAAVSWVCGGPWSFVKRLQWRWGVPLFVAIVVPWNVAILLRSGGEYFNVAVGFHIIKRATSGLEEHGGFPGYYVVLGMLTFFPWSALVPAALASAWARRAETPLAGFLLGWVVGPLILLECVRTKLIHYYLPAIPAVALLTAWLVARVADSGLSLRTWRFGRFACGTFGIVGTTLTVGLAIAGGFILPGPMRAPTLVLSVLCAAATAFGLREVLARRIERAVQGGFAFSALGLLIAAGWLLPASEPYRISPRVGERLAVLERVQGARSVLCTFQPSGTVYTLGHPAPIIRGRQELLAEARRQGKVLTAFVAEELTMLGGDPSLAIEVVEQVAGYNVDKGRPEVLHLAVVRPGSQAIATRPEANPSAPR